MGGRSALQTKGARPQAELGWGCIAKERLLVNNITALVIYSMLVYK